MARLPARLLAAASLIVSCGLFGTAAYADLLASIRADGRIRVAIAVGVPLFSYLDENNRLVGSDVDTAQLLAKDLGVRLEIDRVTNADRIKALDVHAADIIVSSLSITPERERVIDFSVPYAKLFTLVAAPTDQAIKSYGDLAGRRVGVTRLTSNAALLIMNAPKADIVSFDDDATLIKATVAGKVDIVSTQEAVLASINAQRAANLLEEKFVQKDFDLAVGMPKNEKALRDWINNWVVENLRNGKLNAIFRHHHGRDLPAELRPRT